MAEPVEMVKGGQRQTVYSEVKASALEQEGWQRVKNLTPEQQEELANRPPLPWNGYDDMAIADVLAKAEGLEAARIQEIITYETATKNRAGVLNVLAKGASAKTPEQQLEAETGKDFVQSGANPPTYVEMDAPAKDNPAAGGITPENDVPGAMNQGRAGRGVPKR